MKPHKTNVNNIEFEKKIQTRLVSEMVNTTLFHLLIYEGTFKLELVITITSYNVANTDYIGYVNNTNVK